MVCGDVNKKEDIYHFLLHCEMYKAERHHLTDLQQPYIADEDRIIGILLFDRATLRRRKKSDTSWGKEERHWWRHWTKKNLHWLKKLEVPLQWRSEGGASAPGRRPEGGAKILPKIFFNLYNYGEILRILIEKNENVVIFFFDYILDFSAPPPPPTTSQN